MNANAQLVALFILAMSVATSIYITAFACSTYDSYLPLVTPALMGMVPLILSVCFDPQYEAMDPLGSRFTSEQEEWRQTGVFVSAALITSAFAVNLVLVHNRVIAIGALWLSSINGVLCGLVIAAIIFVVRNPVR